MEVLEEEGELKSPMVPDGLSSLYDARRLEVRCYAIRLWLLVTQSLMLLIYSEDELLCEA